ncbi:hypothetical protein P691DRAFT_548876 [Macrolepiota fuliginosa MF-IS2]|uniref:DUF6533 domain-containing protein n=1 Tax=Macrolepiota fuliginosa MF-IS2 TaxID=1400762 RepID=A0A9P6BXF9_9AGAR|nr:hypothetical protein P691DRAFT_548876 [Macrolepiota fuliginosa MF-IS2]
MVPDPAAAFWESDRIVILTYREQIDQYFNVASVAYWLYEYFLTIIPEISLIWSSQWTSVKVLYFLTRYSPFIDSGLTIPGYGALMLRFQRITHSVVACRVILQTRSRRRGQQDGFLDDMHGDLGSRIATPGNPSK